MSFTRETLHTARKSHRCDACRQRIEAGEQYIRWTGMCDGEFGTGAYHTDCRVWEIKVNNDAGLGADEWLNLGGHVAEDGPAVLYGAPEAVRARFGLGVGAAGADARGGAA